MTVIFGILVATIATRTRTFLAILRQPVKYPVIVVKWQFIDEHQHCCEDITV
ncbi:hypothetical protein [Teredinibacter franksiae]|uniref:hypothetical protein n=1 Tax=Teredinibacter franksiae TaxID=2761453 RepID=UPI0016283489|nr:hypothetical protein [Teredinibacter franksiae]